MVAVKVSLADLLSALLAPSISAQKRRSVSSVAVRQPTEDERSTVKMSLYLYPETATVLDELQKQHGGSKTSLVNDAINFYAERGEYLGEMIKTSVREALRESRQEAG